LTWRCPSRCRRSRRGPRPHRSALVAHWDIAADEALAAWLWSWAENQVMAALKTVPLGQVAGQRILLELGQRIPSVVEHALSLGDEELSNFAPGFAIACARHETQYSRLFRS
jgi:urease accessory protein